MGKDKLIRAEFEPATSGLTCRRSTNRYKLALYWRSPYFVNILGGGGGDVSQKSLNHRREHLSTVMKVAKVIFIIYLLKTPDPV